MGLDVGGLKEDEGGQQVSGQLTGDEDGVEQSVQAAESRVDGGHLFEGLLQVLLHAHFGQGRDVGVDRDPQRTRDKPQQDGAGDKRGPVRVEVAGHVDAVHQPRHHHRGLDTDVVDDGRREETGEERGAVDAGEGGHAQTVKLVEAALQVLQGLEGREDEEEGGGQDQGDSYRLLGAGVVLGASCHFIHVSAQLPALTRWIGNGAVTTSLTPGYCISNTRLLHF